MNTEMTARDYSEATLKLARSIGPGAQIWTYLHSGSSHIFNATMYSRGVGYGDAEFSVTGNEFGELYKSLADKWAEYGEAHRARTIRKMALAIIRITAELGECTDAALRNCGEFDPGQINAYGEQACTDANEIAGKGPFSIVVKGGANAEAA
jgi:hypothetical protein